MADYVVKQGDTAPPFADTLLDNLGNPVNLTGATVRFVMRPQRRRLVKVAAAATVVQVGDGSDGSKGKVRYSQTSGDVDTPGLYDVEWEVTYSGGKIETFPNGRHAVALITGDLD